MADWKKYLSYVYPVIVHRESSDHGYQLEVTWENGRLVLNTDKANYSFGSLHKVFRKTFKAIPPKLDKEGRVLVLGFGVGSVAHILLKERGLHCHIAGVEYDQQVIELGKRFFKTESYPNTNVICNDAYMFLENCTDTFQVIVVDLFQELTVPEKFQQQEFLMLLKDHLSTSGQIYFNYVTNNTVRKQAFNSLKKLGEQIFSKSETYNPTPINRVLIFEK